MPDYIAIVSDPQEGRKTIKFSASCISDAEKDLQKMIKKKTKIIRLERTSDFLNSPVRNSE